jgi:hypothetical protein
MMPESGTGLLPPLAGNVQRGADKAFELLKSDPLHPSLHFKKLDDLWSARVGLHHRALAVKVSDGSSGSGSAHMPSTTRSLTDARDPTLRVGNETRYYLNRVQHVDREVNSLLRRAVSRRRKEHGFSQTVLSSYTRV